MNDQEFEKLLEQNELVQAIVAFSLQQLAADPEKGELAQAVLQCIQIEVDARKRIRRG